MPHYLLLFINWLCLLTDYAWVQASGARIWRCGKECFGEDKPMWYVAWINKYIVPCRQCSLFKVFLLRSMTLQSKIPTERYAVECWADAQCLHGFSCVYLASRSWQCTVHARNIGYSWNSKWDTSIVERFYCLGMFSGTIHSHERFVYEKWPRVCSGVFYHRTSYFQWLSWFAGANPES